MRNRTTSAFKNISEIEGIYFHTPSKLFVGVFIELAILQVKF